MINVMFDVLKTNRRRGLEFHDNYFLHSSNENTKRKKKIKCTRHDPFFLVYTNSTFGN
jgi:hypothetical protein